MSKSKHEAMSAQTTKAPSTEGNGASIAQSHSTVGNGASTAQSHSTVGKGASTTQSYSASTAQSPSAVSKSAASTKSPSVVSKGAASTRSPSAVSKGAASTKSPSAVSKGAASIKSPPTAGKGAPTTSTIAPSAMTTNKIPNPEESTNVADAGKNPTEQQGAENQGQGDAKPKKRNSLTGKRKGKPGKIHIRLPPIEAYQKDLCFAAEAPGRVVVRLERLMGSDKIRPVDGKYMETLIQRLEEEEKIAWDRKIKLRKKAERERYRQLAISGLMEPCEGMEDLYDHPVFRVNRILNRLSSLDNTFSNNPALIMPPIVPVDPFETDETGAFFKEYPKHRALRKEWEKYKDMQPQRKDAEEEEIVTQESKSNMTAAATKTKVLQTANSQKSAVPSKSPKSKAVVFEKSKASTTHSKASAADKSKSVVSSKTSAPMASTATSVLTTSPPSDIEEEDEYDEELMEEDLVPPASAGQSITEKKEVEATEELTELEQISQQFDKEYAQSLAALQDKYGVPKSDGFENEWKPYRSEMIDKLFTDFEKADEMFDAARDLFDVFTRPAMLTQEHLKKNRTKSAPSKVKSGSKKQSVSTLESKASQPASSAQALEESRTVEEIEEEDEEEEIFSDEPDLTDAEENEEEEIGEETELIPVDTDEEEFQEAE